MRPGAATLVLVLLAPTAAAWPAAILAPVDEGLSVRTSLLLAGAIEAQGAQAYAAPVVGRAGFGDDLTVTYCPDRGNRPDACGAQPQHTQARIRVLAGGLVVQPAADAPLRLSAPAAPAMLGGGNLSVNRVDLPPSLFVGGPATVRAEGASFVVRALGEDAAVEIRGSEGFRTYEGTGYTLYVQGAEDAFLEARGVVLGMPANASSLSLRRAPAAVAEASLSLDDLHRLVRAVVPPEAADRRSDFAEAYGPFQVSPVLLNGVAASARNLTLAEDARGLETAAPSDRFLLVRFQDLALAPDGANWTGAGNATYLVHGSDLLMRPGESDRLPLVACGVLAAAAVAGRLLTRRETPARPVRAARAALVAAGFAFLTYEAVRSIDRLFGVDPLAQRAALAARTETQLLVLAAAMALAAILLVGLSTASLARSAFSLAGNPRARFLPAFAAGFVVAIFLYVEAPALASLVQLVVRL